MNILLYGNENEPARNNGNEYTNLAEIDIHQKNIYAGRYEGIINMLEEMVLFGKLQVKALRDWVEKFMATKNLRYL